MKAIGAIELVADRRSYLQEVGLSKECIALYELLLQRNELTAHQASTYTNQFSAAQYRLFYKLEVFGLVRRIAGRPLRFVAVTPALALPAALTTKQQVLKNLLAKSLSKADAPGDETLRIVIGRQALYSEYARLAAEARHTIAIYAIGIAYSDKLAGVQRAAIKRGVRIQHVVQQIKPSNFHVVHAWQHIGVQIRLAPSERGFHVMVFDSSLALISFSNPRDTDDRLSILTSNPAACKLFGAYFDALWQEAREVEA